LNFTTQISRVMIAAIMMDWRAGRSKPF